MRKVTINSRLLAISAQKCYPSVVGNVAGNWVTLFKSNQPSLFINLVSKNIEQQIRNKMTGQDNSDLVYLSEDSLERRLSTFEDEQLIISFLKEVIGYRVRNVSSWIVESKVKNLCNFYKYLLKPHRYSFLKVLAADYAVNHEEVTEAAKNLIDNVKDEEQKVTKYEEKLKNLLTPKYCWLFMMMGKLEHGVKFLVDLRTDVLDLLGEQDLNETENLQLQQLNITLREILSMWFSVGFLNLERVTWCSPCEMLQKISEYEAVHPVRSWTDLKRRVGPYRRCFVYLHSSMPGEPLVVLHTALCDEISSSTKGIVAARSRMSVDSSTCTEIFVDPQTEDASKIKAAVFYSVTSTQRGLQGIELGNYIIKRVVRELQTEFPTMVQFSSLSPIPKFRTWLFDKLKNTEHARCDVFLQNELTDLSKHLQVSNEEELYRTLKKLLSGNTWLEDVQLMDMLQVPLMRNCVRYLYLEKRRGYALDNVANFHLRNGAVMWRLNWYADLSPRGLSNSCGIMVNYRYFLEETETNSRNYIEEQTIKTTQQILTLVDQVKQHVSKI